MALTNNLYPPIRSNYIEPAFTMPSNSSTHRLYFSISPLNDISEVRGAQVSIRNQITGRDSLNITQYPSGFKNTQLFEDSSVTGPEKYYIIIGKTDIQGGMQIGVYYKVQIRLCSQSATSFPTSTPQSITAWNEENKNNFSEWSQVILIRMVSTPVTSFKSPLYQYNSSIAQVLFGFEYSSSKETDKVKTYRVGLYDEDKNLLEVSDNIYPSQYADSTQLNYVFNKELENNKLYYVAVKVVTVAGYSQIYTESFLPRFETAAASTYPILIEQAPEIGALKVSVRDKIFKNEVIIRRTSSESNFTVWEDLLFFVDENGINSMIINNNNEYSIPSEGIYVAREHYGIIEGSFSGSILNGIYDVTVEDGVSYLYGIQEIDENGIRTNLVKGESPVAAVLETMFISADNKNLKLCAAIDSVKKNIMESKTDSIGSKYPYITRVAATDYNQYSLSGYITYKIEDEQNSISDSAGQIFSSTDNPNGFLPKNKLVEIAGGNDEEYYLERKYRDAVLDFLYKDNVKLLRTPTEGNSLVKITDISLSPQRTLGNLIYNFSATAYEIDDCTLENIQKYNIFSKNDSEDNTVESEWSGL